MANITSIRQTFDKASIAISNDGISAYLAQRDSVGCLSQGIFNNSLDTLRELLEASNSVIFQSVKKKWIVVTFCVDTGIGKSVLYPHLKTQIDTKKLLDEVRADNSGSPDEEFLSFFIGADLSDGDELMGRLGEYFSAKREQYDAEHRVTEIPKVMRWRELKRCVSSIAWVIGVDKEVLEPDCDFDGSISVFMNTNNGNPIKVSGELKGRFERALQLCNGLELECCIDNGTYNLVFYM